MTFNQIVHQIHSKQSFLCVGLDPDRSLFPLHLQAKPDAIYLFNKEIIDATSPYAIAYKPNTAFYEAEGASGWQQLTQTIRYIRQYHPNILIIADAKRCDIGNTAHRYAKAFYQELNVDAVTLSPYMGMDAIDPFLSYKDKWSIVLAITSNDTASDFALQPLTNGKPLYQAVIQKCVSKGSKEQLMFVVGATRPQLLAEVRAMVPEHFLLVPGVGAQGGGVAEVAKYGMNRDCGLLVNVSRDIIYAGNGLDFAQTAGKKAEEIAQEMGRLLAATQFSI
ncbi:MAG: orotidine-5'-phosphate decarboxylase [Prevotellaceae bacterium]|jgi:orotidine-5'-phosphate decarboxylase|nr:orotidine-5'-phosphate decarboxylase [Prevotellaceae bacterium]